jgi:PAS domain S-box-containing protein
MAGQTKGQARAREGASPDDPLLKSEEWLSLAAKGSQLGLWYWNEETQYVYWDAKTCEIFGVPAGSEKPIDTFYQCVHPDDRERVKKVWRYQFEHGLPYEVEFRAAWEDGSIRWVRALGNGHYNKDGKPIRMVGVVFDVTERKEAEQERLELAGLLMNAEEKERSRLAREIHDDFSQRLAVLAVNLEVTEDFIQEDAAREELHKLSNEVCKIGADLHSLSHRLHSSALETLGLTPGIGSFCAEFAAQYQLEIDFVHKDIPKCIRHDTALCLFRIVQEGLRNVRRHSRASKVDVQLKGSADAISLSLSDNGIGFEPSHSLASGGIGIRSMRERARMLGGTFAVLSRPMQGAQITVTVPLNSTRAES